MRASSLQVTETEVAFIGQFASEPNLARLMILDFANVEQ